MSTKKYLVIGGVCFLNNCRGSVSSLRKTCGVRAYQYCDTRNAEQDANSHIPIELFIRRQKMGQQDSEQGCCSFEGRGSLAVDRLLPLNDKGERDKVVERAHDEKVTPIRWRCG